MKKKLLALFLAAVMTVTAGMPAYAAETQIAAETDAGECIQYLTEETKFDGSAEGRKFVSDEDLAKLGTLESITVTVDFKTSSTGLQALTSVNGSGNAADYISLYVNGGNRIGFEIRHYQGNTALVNKHAYADVAGKNLADNKWHTVSFVVDKDKGYALYLDKEQIYTEQADTTYFAGTEGFWEATSAAFGGANRIGSNSNNYLFTGSMRNAKIYGTALAKEDVLKDHAHIEVEEEPTAYPEDIYKLEEYGIFDMGDYDTYNFRIPALVTTKNGVVLAAADQRNTHWNDWGNIDCVVRRSTDNGKTWEEMIDVIDLQSQPYFTGTQSAFLIDPVMIATESGRVYLLVDMFTESTGAANIDGTGTGYVEVDGEDYLALYDASGNLYTLRGSEVYDKDGNKTTYTVDQGSGEDAYHTKGDLYDGEEYLGNIYLHSKNQGSITAPLTIKRTCYLWLTYSDDDGLTWSNPVDITPQIKADWMQFLGVGPGFGIELQHGEHAGRLIFPVYYTIGTPNGGLGFQSSACIYSDDGGKTWTRGESPNDGRINSSGQPTTSQNPSGISQLTESQIIELSSGNLLQFMRNYGGAGKVAVARSTDGGATWSDPINTTATEVYCQLSVLYMDNNGTDGKDRVLMSNSGGPGRTNGMLRIGEVTETEDSFSVTWVEEKLFCPGNYAYSCLTEMADGNYGLLYEHANTIKFTAFNEEYITSDVNLLSPTISRVTYDVEKTGEHNSALPGDTYVFTVYVDQAMTEVKGNPQFRFMLNGKGHFADFREISEDGRSIVFEYEIQDEDEGMISFRGPKIVCDDENYIINEYGYQVSSGDLEVSLGYIGQDPADDSRDIPVSVLKATAGDSQSGEGADKALDNNSSTMWHTDWYNGPSHDNHWIQLELEESYLVDGFRYQPRQSGGNNGIITGYEIQVSNDGENWETVAEGTWAVNNVWKVVSFDPQLVKYVRLQATSAVSDQSILFASAAEVRLTGVKAGACEHAETELKNAKEATCTEDGYTGDEVCKSCGLTIEKGEAIEAVGHTWGEWTVVKEPAVGEEGLKARDCENCDAREEEELPALEPVFLFEDVTDESKWYYDAVYWGHKEGIVNGLTETTFGPGESCTRGQIVTFIWRAEGKPEAKNKEHGFTDIVEGKYYYDAVVWAVEEGIVNGLTETTFGPEETCTRAQMATFLYRHAEEPEVSGESKFTDFVEGKWYYNAAL